MTIQCPGRYIGFGSSWMGACAVSVCALSQALFPWLVLGLSGEEMEVAGHLSHPNRESLTSRTRCVWGHAVTWTPFHEIKQDLSIAFRTEPRRVTGHQASPFHLLGASSVPSPCFLGGTSLPAFLHRGGWCVDCLFCRFTYPSKSSVTCTGFLNHSFSLPQGS